MKRPRQRNSRDENAHIKEKHEAPAEWSEKKRSHKDIEATWTRKGGITYYGYKNHIAVDEGSKLIRDDAAGTASQHDSQVFEELIPDGTEEALADSAYMGNARAALLPLAEGHETHAALTGPAADGPAAYEALATLQEQALNLRPYYCDHAMWRNHFTTSACDADWNAEAFSVVWPEAREDLPGTQEALRRDECPLAVIIGIFDKPESFELNCRRMVEAIRFCQLLDVSVALGLYAGGGEPFVQLAPSYSGPEDDFLLIEGKRYLYVDGQSFSQRADTEAHETLRPLLEGKEAYDTLNIIWKPSAENVAGLMDVLGVLHERGRCYSFSLLIEE